MVSLGDSCMGQAHNKGNGLVQVAFTWMGVGDCLLQQLDNM